SSPLPHNLGWLRSFRLSPVRGMASQAVGLIPLSRNEFGWGDITMQHFIWRGVWTTILAAWLVFGGLASSAMAASVSFEALHYSADRFVPQFHFEGPVTEGDATALAALIDEFVECTPDLLDITGSNCAVVTLNSPGGDYIEGLRLAALMRERAIATVVEANAECYSACAFAFLGGTGY